MSMLWILVLIYVYVLFQVWLPTYMSTDENSRDYFLDF